MYHNLHVLVLVCKVTYVSSIVAKSFIMVRTFSYPRWVFDSFSYFSQIFYYFWPGF